MGYRRDAVYRLNVAGGFAGQKVPAMLFHTLIENGLTHACAARENGTFRLDCVRTGDAVEYWLKNDGSLAARITETGAEKIEEGMGLRYVRTRLQESFPGCWELEYGRREGLWRVRIVIKKGRPR